MVGRQSRQGVASLTEAGGGHTRQGHRLVRHRGVVTGGVEFLQEGGDKPTIDGDEDNRGPGAGSRPDRDDEAAGGHCHCPE